VPLASGNVGRNSGTITTWGTGCGSFLAVKPRLGHGLHVFRGMKDVDVGPSPDMTKAAIGPSQWASVSGVHLNIHLAHLADGVRQKKHGMTNGAGDDGINGARLKPLPAEPVSRPPSAERHRAVQTAADPTSDSFQ
jgi:hypothetical protein